MLHHRNVVDHPWIRARRKLADDQIHIDRKRLQFGLKRFSRRRQFNANGQSVIVSRWENEPSRVMQPAVQLHISSVHVRHGVFRRRVFEPPFAAMVDRQQIRCGDEAGIEIFHMKIIIIERYARKDHVAGHCAVAGFVAKLPDGAFGALRQ